MDKSEEFRIYVSGPITSFFLSEAVNSPTEFEGLLLGDYQRWVHREISDQYDADNRNHAGTIMHEITIRRIVPTGVKFSFYDRRFNAMIPPHVMDAVKKLDWTGKGQQDRPAASSHEQNKPNSVTSAVYSGILGWFRYQKSPSHYKISELAICHALLKPETLSGFPVLKEGGCDVSSYYPWPGNGPLYLFAYPRNNAGILEWNIELKAFNQTTQQFRPVRLQVSNLGDTTSMDYWNLNGSASYARADHMLPGIVPSNDFAKHIVAASDRMAENAKRLLSGNAQELINKIRHVMQYWNQVQKTGATNALSLQSATNCIKYGYSPSKADLELLLQHLYSTIGVKANRPPVEQHHLSANSNVLQANTGDLLDLQESQSSPQGDTASWEVIDNEIDPDVDDETKIRNQDSNVPELADDHVNTRRAKRPKENMSSSSSGANSDEMAEPVNAIGHNVARISQNVTTERPNTRSRAQQQKKPKSSDSGSSAESQEIPSAAIQAMSIRPAAPGKGRGTRLENMAKQMGVPPGFAPTAAGSSTAPPPGFSQQFKST